MRAMCSPLPLLVFLIRANHAHDATPAHDLALVTNPLDRCPDLHMPAILTTTGQLRPAGPPDTPTLASRPNSPDNPRAPRISRHRRHDHAIAFDQPNEIPARSRRRVRDHLVPAVHHNPV